MRQTTCVQAQELIANAGTHRPRVLHGWQCALAANVCHRRVLRYAFFYAYEPGNTCMHRPQEHGVIKMKDTQRPLGGHILLGLVLLHRDYTAVRCRDFELRSQGSGCTLRIPLSTRWMSVPKNSASGVSTEYKADVRVWTKNLVLG